MLALAGASIAVFLKTILTGSRLQALTAMFPW
jgi:hypothetical protein